MKYKNILTKKFLIEQYSILKKPLRIIAKEIKSSGTIVYYYLKKFNIPIRTRSEAQKNRSPMTKETKQKIKEAMKGKKPSNFKGRITNNEGYILIHSFNHSFKNSGNNVFEHRLRVEKELGRYLTKKEVVHHINEIKDDNRIENLMCFISESVHQKFHSNLKNVKSEEIIFDGRLYKKGGLK